MARHGKRSVLVGLLLISCTLSGCGSSTLASLFGQDRYLPNGDKVNFANRHVPPLNPSQFGGSGNADVTSVINAPGTASPTPFDSYPSGAPADNAASGRHVPVENQAAVSDMQAPAVTVASVATQPVTSAPASPFPGMPPADTATKISPPQNFASSSYVPPSSAVPAPAMVAQASDYPPLASVPSTPPHDSNADNGAQFGAMNSQRDQSESARRQLMNDSSAAVLTAPGAVSGTNASPSLSSPPADVQTPAPEAGVPQAPAPTPVPAPTSVHHSWLHNLFHPKDRVPAAAAGQDMATGPNVMSGATTPKDLMNVPSPAAAAPSAAMPFPSVSAPAPLANANAPAVPEATSSPSQAGVADAQQSKEIAPGITLTPPPADFTTENVSSASAPAPDAAHTPAPDMASPSPVASAATPSMPASSAAPDNTAIALPSPPAVNTTPDMAAPPVISAAAPASAIVPDSATQSLPSPIPVPSPEPAPMASAPAALPEPAPVAAAPVPATNDASAAAEPVHLHPPTSGGGDAALPDMTPLTHADAAPTPSPASGDTGNVQLTPPSVLNDSAANGQYVNDSRYAERRAHSDSSN